MQFSFTSEQEEFRSVLRRFLEDKSPPTVVRRLMETDAGWDRASWRDLNQQLGLTAVHIPEAYGGQGFGFVELGIVLEEMGRALLCAPYFASTVLAATAIMNAGTEAQKHALLPPIADGDSIATLAFTEPNGRWDASGHRNDGDAGRRAVPAGRRQELRARRPHGRPDRRAGPPPGFGRRRRTVVLHRARRRARAVAPCAESDGPDPQAGAAGVRGRSRRTCLARRAPRAAPFARDDDAGRGVPGERNGRRRGAVACSRRWTMRICGCSSAAPSPRSSR